MSKKLRHKDDNGTLSLFDAKATTPPPPFGKGETISIGIEVRRKAYEAVREFFGDQNKRVMGVLLYFGAATPWGIYRLLEREMLVTSIRRCLTNLHKLGYVKETGSMMEEQKAPNTIYVITPEGVANLWQK